MKKVGVVVLNYKVKDLALKCLESVKKSSYKNLEIYLVDNDSKDGIEEEVNGKDIIFIQTGDNLGYTGNNVGIKRALKDRCELVFILNPDTEITKDTIANLVTGMDKHSADIANPKILFADKKTIWFAGGIFDLANVLGSNRGVDQKDKGQFDEDWEIELGTGAALMVKKEVFEKIGFLDEKYFLYYEDSDFCFRAKKAGFKIYYLPKAVVYHENAKSTGLGSPLQDYFITRNRMLFASKFLPLRTRFALLREALRNLKNPTRRLALWDYLNDNFGKGSFIK
jgi:GT2 family glycosyltransferase